ncbi:MAG TPA: choice-of-anchor D domain-containing protein [Blastocatellia bacterium]|nr:choice-of-anchor D domain-containing protein [Blastocatellia bacterium]
MKKILMLSLILIIPVYSSMEQAAAGRPGGQTRPQEKTPPVASINPGSLAFGDQVAKTSSKPQRITVTNTGGKDLYVNSVVLGGDDQSEFAIQNDSCTGATIPSSKSCVVDVVFTPTAKESRKATLVFTDSAVDSPQRAALSGNGINSVDVPPSAGPVAAALRQVVAR